MEIFMTTIPFHKEKLTEKLDQLIIRYGKRPNTKRTANGILYTVEFNTSEAKTRFSNDVSKEIPELFKSER